MANKRTSLRERSERPIDDLFKPSIENNNEKQISVQENNGTSKHKNMETSKQENMKYVRQTYYLTKEQIDALSVYSTFEKIDKSEIVRNSLEKYIPQKYKDMSKEIKD